MTIVRLIFFGCRLLFVTKNFVFGMNNVVTEYEISSSDILILYLVSNFVLFFSFFLFFF